MKLSWRHALVAALLFALRPALADDTVTNIGSPIASYQYPDDFNTDALTKASVQSSIVSFQYPEPLGDEVLINDGIESPIVSFQFPQDLGSLALTNGVIMSPIASYQYCEWPGNGILNLQSSPVVSYFYQLGNQTGQFVVSGKVTGANGIAVSGATISVMVDLTTLAQTSTDANGNYQFSPLVAGVYTLESSAVLYVSSAKVLTLNGNTAHQDFKLFLMPSKPATQQVVRAATVSYTVNDLMGSRLLIYDGLSFVPITEDNLPSPNLPTIVMTHGWVPALADSSIMDTPFDRWPTNMAALLQRDGITPTTANILAWDWRYAAMSIDPGVPADQTPSQGVGLGEALQTFLGQSYTNPLHFLGHSLGTMVNASAINYLHGEQIGARDYSPTPWNNNLVHVTLFDQAQLAEVMGSSPNYQSALPFVFTWADNYKSIVGLGNLSGAVNVDLQKGALTAVASRLNPIGIADDSHGYPMDWYGTSIQFPSDTYNPLGFKRSYEYAGTLFPPTDIATGTTYHQTPSNFDELALEPVSSISSFGLFPDVVVQTAVDTIQYTEGVSVQIGDTLENDASSVFGYVNNSAALGGQDVINLFNSAMISFSLTTIPYLPLTPQLREGPRPLGLGNGNSSGLPPMVWVPIRFPSNAVAMTFDFIIAGNPADDVLVCGIGTNNLFSLGAKYIPSSQISASRLIAVSQWAGTTNELFFGFMGGTSTNATLQIQNIRFYSLQTPQLAIAKNVNTTALTWPLSTGNYSLATSTNLTASDWVSVTNIPAISDNSYILTNSWFDQTRFFRLEPQ